LSACFSCIGMIASPLCVLRVRQFGEHVKGR
jgi:hypothetical protein